MIGAPGQNAVFFAHPVTIGQSLVGVVTQESDGFRFLALDEAFAALEAGLFDCADAARRVALELWQAGAWSSQNHRTCHAGQAHHPND